MPALERIFETAKEKTLRVVMPEMDDPRISGAADKLEKERLARVLDLSEPTQEMIDVLVLIVTRHTAMTFKFYCDSVKGGMVDSKSYCTNVKAHRDETSQVTDLSPE